MENGNYTLIDGDVEYGARVHYSCDPGYVINVEDNILQCNEEQNWIGTIPTCTFVECELLYGVVNGTDYAYIVQFYCLLVLMAIN